MEIELPMLIYHLKFSKRGRLRPVGKPRYSLLPYLGAQPLMPSADEKKSV